MELKAENISFKYNKNNSNYVLKNVNITIDNNKVLGLVGDSGSGKSTLCKILSGYIDNYEGSITIDNEKIPHKGFNPVQLIFQHPELTVNPKWRMHQVLEESWDVNDEILEEFGIQKSWLQRYPNELSGGELQRFAVLRALNPKTKFLIADEMTTMLDAITQVQIWNLVLDLTKKRNVGLLVVSHNKNLVKRICDDVIYLKDINNP